MIAFTEDMRATLARSDEVQARITALIERLKRWQENGVNVPVRAWARDYKNLAHDGTTDDNPPRRYDDGHPNGQPGGWTPPDRYKIVDVHADAREGTMVWIEPATAQGFMYNVLPRTIEFVDDETIQAYWQK